MNLFRLKDDNFTNQKFNGRALLPVALVLAWFAISPRAQAVVPAPDGGYPGGNTAEGQAALLSLTTGSFNTAVGFSSLRSDTTGSFNTAIGAGTLFANTAENNTATGAAALLSNTEGFGNTANGAFALFGNTTGSGNTAFGYGALSTNATGANNTALGAFAGNGVTTASGIICIRSPGANVSNSCFIGNIRDVTTAQPDAIPVLIDSAGQLGTMSSSARFKKQIKPMGQASESILALKPVGFRYKVHKDSTPQFGLIAEEVAKVNPDLVIYDANGKPYTVRYEAVNAMLLNEFLKEHRKVAKLEAMVAQQHKDFEAAVAELKGQIQRVSAQIELNKPAPQTVLNSQ
jgi:Chaperone of endosialidase